MGGEAPFFVGSRALRISQDPEALLTATDLAQRLLAEGQSAESVSGAILDLIPDREVAEAIVAFLEGEQASVAGSPRAEPVLGIYIATWALLFIASFYWVARWLYGLVESNPQSLLAGALAAFGQAAIVRLSWRMLKSSGIGLTDTLNGATYPTILHRHRVSTIDFYRLRRERIRLLIADMVVRMAQGHRFRDLYAELTRIELTRPATVWLLIQARLGLMIGVNFPPYHLRSRAFWVAGGAGLGCLVGLIVLYARRESSPAELQFLGCWAALFVLEFLRSPAKDPLPMAD